MVGDFSGWKRSGDPSQMKNPPLSYVYGSIFHIAYSTVDMCASASELELRSRAGWKASFLDHKIFWFVWKLFYGLIGLNGYYAQLETNRAADI